MSKVKDLVDRIETRKNLLLQTFSETSPYIMENTDTALVVNLFAGAGAGKTTSAWGLCYELKLKGYNVEYVNEICKEYIWEDKIEILDGTYNNQLFLVNEQNKKIQRLCDKVDIIVTDSPLPLYCLYAKENQAEIEKLSLDLFSQHNNFNIFINRNESISYETVGRIHSLQESKEKDMQIKSLLKDYNIDYVSAGATDVKKLSEVIDAQKKLDIKELKAFEDNLPENEYACVVYFSDTNYTGLESTINNFDSLLSDKESYKFYSVLLNNYDNINLSDINTATGFIASNTYSKDECIEMIRCTVELNKHSYTPLSLVEIEQLLSKGVIQLPKTAETFCLSDEDAEICFNHFSLYASWGSAESEGFSIDTRKDFDKAMSIGADIIPNSNFDDYLKFIETPYFLNSKYINKNKEKLEDSKFLIDKENNLIHWYYFNPDSNCGGQLVHNMLSPSVIYNASCFNNGKEFYDALESNCTQELVDITDCTFQDEIEQFISLKPSFKGITNLSMIKIVYAGVDMQKDPIINYCSKKSENYKEVEVMER